MTMSEEARIQKNRANLTPLPPEVLQQLQEIELNAIARFAGMTEELESALGFLRLGFQLDWRALAVIHSKRTVRKYEQILGIKSRELFPAETPASERSRGYLIAKTLSNFWKGVSGNIKIENRREFTQS